MHNSYRSDDRRAGPTQAILRSGFHGPLPVLYRFGGLIMTIASLKWSQKATATREILASNDVRTLIANQLGVFLRDDFSNRDWWKGGNGRRHEWLVAFWLA